MDRACLILGKRLRLDPGETAFVAFAFEVALPRGLSCDGFRFLLNGKEAVASCRDGHLAFQAEGRPGSAIEWEVVSCEGG